MFFLSRKYRVLAVIASVVEKYFPERVMPTVDERGWLVFYQPVHKWAAQLEKEFPEDMCECNPLRVCSACRARYDHQRQYQDEFTTIPF